MPQLHAHMRDFWTFQALHLSLPGGAVALPHCMRDEEGFFKVGLAVNLDSWFPSSHPHFFILHSPPEHTPSLLQ